MGKAKNVDSGTGIGDEPSPTWLGGPLGFVLRAWRKRRNLSQTALAERVGLSARALSFIETGRARPTRTSLIWLARALGLAPTEEAQLLEAAGFVRGIVDPPGSDPLGAHRADVERMLRLLPVPAMVHDRMGTVLASNAAFHALVAPYVDVANLDGESSGHAILQAVRPHLENAAELASFYRRRVLAGLLLGEELDRALADLDRRMGPPPETPTGPGHFGVPLRLRTHEGTKHYWLVTSTLGSPQDVEMRNLRMALVLQDTSGG